MSHNVSQKFGQSIFNGKCILQKSADQQGCIDAFNTENSKIKWSIQHSAHNELHRKIKARFTWCFLYWTFWDSTATFILVHFISYLDDLYPATRTFHLTKLYLTVKLKSLSFIFLNFWQNKFSLHNHLSTQQLHHFRSISQHCTVSCGKLRYLIKQ